MKNNNIFILGWSIPLIKKNNIFNAMVNCSSEGFSVVFWIPCRFGSIQTDVKSVLGALGQFCLISLDSGGFFFTLQPNKSVVKSCLSPNKQALERALRSSSHTIHQEMLWAWSSAGKSKETHTSENIRWHQRTAVQTQKHRLKETCGAGGGHPTKCASCLKKHDKCYLSLIS